MYVTTKNYVGYSVLSFTTISTECTQIHHYFTQLEKKKKLIIYSIQSVSIYFYSKQFSILCTPSPTRNHLCVKVTNVIL